MREAVAVMNKSLAEMPRPASDEDSRDETLRDEADDELEDVPDDWDPDGSTFTCTGRVFTVLPPACTLALPIVYVPDWLAMSTYE